MGRIAFSLYAETQLTYRILPQKCKPEKPDNLLLLNKKLELVLLKLKINHRKAQFIFHIDIRPKLAVFKEEIARML